MDMLTQLGYSNLAGAADGKQALEILSKQGDFDLILMDISMPRMDGIEATKHIRSGAVGQADIPIIAITAHTMTGDEATFLDVGMNAHIAKPFTRREVETILTPFTQSVEESPE
jgi:CheY-like chemotaxis protein